MFLGVKSKFLEILVRRVRRDMFDENDDDPSGDRIEGLEVILLKNKLEFQKMQRQMLRMNRYVCYCALEVTIAFFQYRFLEKQIKFFSKEKNRHVHFVKFQIFGFFQVRTLTLSIFAKVKSCNFEMNKSN